MKSSEKLTTESKQLDCFKSIDDLPIKAWFDIHKTGDYRLLLKNIITINKEDFSKLYELWQVLYNEYIEKFGLSETFKDDLNKQIEIAKLKATYMITGKKHLRTQIRIKEEELKSENKGESKPFELESLLAKMSKYYGFKLESRELTVTQYYSYLNEVK